MIEFDYLLDLLSQQTEQIQFDQEKLELRILLNKFRRDVVFGAIHLLRYLQMKQSYTVRKNPTLVILVKGKIKEKDRLKISTLIRLVAGINIRIGRG